MIIAVVFALGFIGCLLFGVWGLAWLLDPVNR